VGVGSLLVAPFGLLLVGSVLVASGIVVRLLRVFPCRSTVRGCLLRCMAGVVSRVPPCLVVCMCCSVCCVVSRVVQLIFLLFAEAPV